VIDFAAIAREAAAKKAADRPTPVVQERVHVQPVASAAYLMKQDETWGPKDLQDYVMNQIEMFHGPQLRNALKEKAIFTSFLDRHGDKAVAIARFAFEVERGLWHRAPVSPNHFCKGADWWFSDKIAERL
jgi:hypothetical protein